MSIAKTDLSVIGIGPILYTACVTPCHSIAGMTLEGHSATKGQRPRKMAPRTSDAAVTPL